MPYTSIWDEMKKTEIVKLVENRKIDIFGKFAVEALSAPVVRP
jgi:hypothetical protein